MNTKGPHLFELIQKLIRIENISIFLFAYISCDTKHFCYSICVDLCYVANNVL